MTAAEIIDEIQRLPRTEQEKVVRFTSDWEENRMLSGAELEALMKELIATSDAAEKERLREKLLRGFYGGLPDA